MFITKNQNENEANKQKEENIKNKLPKTTIPPTQKLLLLTPWC